LAPRHDLEQMQVLAGLGMIPDGLVPGDKAHVPDLALADIAKGAIRFPAIVVAVLFTALAREEEDQRMLFGGANAALPLPSVPIMQIASPVDASLLEHDPSFLSQPWNYATGISPFTRRWLAIRSFSSSKR
jgi:hypothetical protein